MEQLTNKEINKINRINEYMRKMRFGEKIDFILRNLGEAFKAGTPVNAVNAKATLTFIGAIFDSETVLVGSEVYEFLADVALSKTNPANIAVDINSHTTKASGTLTVALQPLAGDTFTIGGGISGEENERIYTFLAAGATPVVGDIVLGTDLAATKLAIVAAINGDDGVNLPHPLVTAGDFVVDDAAITALIGGAAGNSIPTTSIFDDTNSKFGAATLANGGSCTAGNAITALALAVTSNAKSDFTAVDGDGDTVVFTAKVAGVAANSLDSIADTQNADFGAETFAGGINGTVGEINDSYIDATNIYFCIAPNTVSGKNWRKVQLSAL